MSALVETGRQAMNLALYNAIEKKSNDSISIFLGLTFLTLAWFFSCYLGSISLKFHSL